MKLTLPLIFTTLLLAGCSSHTDSPNFSASGYLADRGAVRIWRKNSQQQLSHMVTIYTPFNGAATETTDYQWQDGKLVSLERHLSGKQPDNVTLRFDHEGTLSFMQRQLAGKRELLSSDEVALYQFDAQRMAKISDDLLGGRVQLIQGRWSSTGTVLSCQGNELSPPFDLLARERIEQQQKTSPTPLNIAWLETPDDAQLLLVSTGDLCQSEPKEADFPE